MIRLDPWAYVTGAAMLLMLPLPWLMAAVLAAAFHELCHLAAVAALGGRVYSLMVGPVGAVMEASLPSPRRELLAALAGPAGSFCLAALHPLAPHLALCALVQGAFNLLPLYPLDGGRALRCLLSGHLSQRQIRRLEGGIALAFGAAALFWWPLLGGALMARWLFLKKPGPGKPMP